MTHDAPATLSTVSGQFIEDWLDALGGLRSEAEMASFKRRAGLAGQKSRVTLDQIVSLYQIAAVETGDEMMGLWSRPVRPRALQHLLTSVKEARGIPAALYRFSTFWNLLLDDYQFALEDAEGCLTLRLEPQGAPDVQRFGHMLILKLAHGLVSWLAGREMAVAGVEFTFERPEFAEDYAVIFPAPLRFGTSTTSITFEKRHLAAMQARDASDLDRFLKNAPRDWIFTRSQEHTESLKVRTHLGQTGWADASLEKTALFMHVTPRTLIRRLRADGTSFQMIKDGLRRDLAIRDLQAGRKSVEAIALDVGFSSAANFHKAFRRWTGSAPSAYRLKL
ncbi:MAG: AraC family transcriptional regulator ligand-binding domain-containing protein [Pseudomonadota bacterium]